MVEFAHTPVLFHEVLEALAIRPGGVYIDCTVGGGGHTEGMLQRGAGRVLGLDQDTQALDAARERLAPWSDRVTLVQGNFRELGKLAPAHGFINVQGILLDVGVSSHQLDTATRGFSFGAEGPLDMRMDQTQAMMAEDLVNTAEEGELADLIFRYGEERASRRIARAIVRERPIRTTTQLAAIVQRAVGGKSGRIHPATRTFQALRIAVNDELQALEAALAAAPALLAPGGRLAVISFHSLEDRIVKQTFQTKSAICMLPPRLFAEQCPHLRAKGGGPRPCIYIESRDCDYAPVIELVTNKPVVATSSEETANPRSRSAKLRVAEKIAAPTSID